MISLKETVICDKWDCDCALNHQRGCCCAANEMFQVEDDNYERMTSLWDGINMLKNEVGVLSTGIKVAFKANMDPTLFTGSAMRCFGPFNTNAPIAYTRVTLNDGNGYNPSLGVFTAPHAGVYVFSYTAYSYVEAYQRLYHKVQMMKNGEVMTSIWEDNREDGEDSGTQTLTVEMQRGDQVYMELESGRKLCKHLELNTFTGYIVYASL
ncbi:cerebellin 18 [Corythoichthys intestinalis]|uniref:cerebellin 18 n=1 Tax=Corythoichthys intestinalis TaxID=161448 RepID=UPI0025A5EF4E|nr:cerebellin 18 [Corythoichthys intestinalis]XP_061797387.1 cerebellin-4-like [Nerophis lumbriciformis]